MCFRRGELSIHLPVKQCFQVPWIRAVWRGTHAVHRPGFFLACSKVPCAGTYGVPKTVQPVHLSSTSGQPLGSCFEDSHRFRPPRRMCPSVSPERLGKRGWSPGPGGGRPNSDQRLADFDLVGTQLGSDALAEHTRRRKRETDKMLTVLVLD